MADNDTYSGNPWEELILGSDANETLGGAGGGDIIDGSGGNDSIKGGDASTRDILFGNPLPGLRRRAPAPGRRSPTGFSGNRYGPADVESGRRARHRGQRTRLPRPAPLSGGEGNPRQCLPRGGQST